MKLHVTLLEVIYGFAFRAQKISGRLRFKSINEPKNDSSKKLALQEIIWR